MRYDIQRFLDGGFDFGVGADTPFFKFDSKEQLFEFKAQLEAEHPEINVIGLVDPGRIDYAYTYNKTRGRIMYSTYEHVGTAIPVSSLAICETHTDDLLEVLGV